MLLSNEIRQCVNGDVLIHIWAEVQGLLQYLGLAGGGGRCAVLSQQPAGVTAHRVLTAWWLPVPCN